MLVVVVDIDWIRFKMKFLFMEKMTFQYLATSQSSAVSSRDSATSGRKGLRSLSVSKILLHITRGSWRHFCTQASKRVLGVFSSQTDLGKFIINKRSLGNAIVDLSRKFTYCNIENILPSAEKEKMNYLETVDYWKIPSSEYALKELNSQGKSSNNIF